MTSARVYLKDSCPGVSMISMPGIRTFSLSNQHRRERRSQSSPAVKASLQNNLPKPDHTTASFFQWNNLKTVSNSTVFNILFNIQLSQRLKMAHYLAHADLTEDPSLILVIISSNSIPPWTHRTQLPRQPPRGNHTHKNTFYGKKGNHFC